MKTLGTVNGKQDEDPAAQPDIVTLWNVLERVLDARATLPVQVVLRSGDASLEVAWPSPSASTAPVALAADTGVAAAAETSVTEDAPDEYVITAPLVGTFYRRPEPDAPPFIEIGDVVRAGEQVAIVEAMKLMNRIEADRTGRVIDIVIADGTPVEYGQALFILEPVEEN
jgi:acetyl-CoA carboxylase biotin carboxyl carrier protein